MSSLHFSVTGEFLTETSRTLVLSGEGDRAEKFLMESLHGMNFDQAHQILNGTHCLVGSSSDPEGVEMVEDADSQGYQADLRSMYAGRTRMSRGGTMSWWRPVAYWQWTAKAVKEVTELGEPESFFHQRALDWLQRWQTEQGEIVRYVRWDEAYLSLLKCDLEDTPLAPSHAWGDLPVFWVPCDAPPPCLRTKALKQGVLEAFVEAMKEGALELRKIESIAIKPNFHGFHEDEDPEFFSQRQLPKPLNKSLRDGLGKCGGAARPRPVLKPKSKGLDILDHIYAADAMGKALVRDSKDTPYTEEDYTPGWPTWEGVGASVARYPNPVMPSITSVIKQMKQVQEELSAKRIEHAREQIVKQANDTGWMDFRWGARMLRVPKGAFECWSLRRTVNWKDATPWKIMSGEEWKQMGDDPYHTDWMLGAGLDLDLWRSDKTLRDAAYDASFALQHEGRSGLLGTILVPLRVPVIASVVHPKPNQSWYVAYDCQPSVIVLPNLSPQYVNALLGASLVITEEGGALAHLSQLGREKGLPILRVQNARKLIPEGCTVRVDISGEIFFPGQP